VLVVYEASRGGERALLHAADLARAPNVTLTVVVLAAQDTNPGCCVVGTPAYNAGIREDAMGELARAAELLGAAADRADFKLHVQGRDAPIELYAARGGYEVIVLGASRGLRTRRAVSKLTKSLRAETSARIDVICATR